MTCEPCPEGGDCSERGQKFSSLRPADGFWKSTLEGIDFHRCILDRHCPAGVCLENHEGPLCGQCKAGYYRTQSFKCAECPDHAASYIFLLTMFFVMLTIVVAHTLIMSRVQRREHLEAEFENETNYALSHNKPIPQIDEFPTLMRLRDIRPKPQQEHRIAQTGPFALKIMISFAQVCRRCSDCLS